MLTSTIHTRWIARLFVLIYLLISVSTANACFWCQGTENTSHLELNPVGSCWALPALEDDELSCCKEITKQGVSLSVPEEACFDYPVYSSVLIPSNRTSPLSKITALDITLTPLPSTPCKPSGIARFANLTHASQLPHHQALTAMRTVILLH